MKSRVDRILNLLVDEVEERLQGRQRAALSEIERPAPIEPTVAEAPASSAERAGAPVKEVAAMGVPEPEPELPPLPTDASDPDALYPHGRRYPRVTSHAARLMGRLALGLLVAVVLVNIPFNRHGTTLATAMPDSASLIVREGLVVKEDDDPELYVYRDGQFRWISSLDAFDHYRYTWGDVHIVEDGYLDRYEKGPAIHVLLKCHSSPHIYRLEEGEKRWIRDIDTFKAEEHVWEDVRFVSCQYLRDLPDGETIPPGSGPPPQP